MMTSPSILFATAVAAEAAPLGRRLGISELAPGVTRAGLADASAAVLIAGIGRPADAVFAAALDDLKPEAVLNFGFAGALDAGLAPGTIVVVDRWHALEAPRVVVARPARSLSENLQACLQAASVPALAADRALHDPLTRDRVAVESGARIVEMEGGPWARLAASRGVPFAGVRIVSDHANRPLPEHRHLLLTPDGRILWKRWVGALMRARCWHRPVREWRRLTAARRDWRSAVGGLDLAASRLPARLSVAPGAVVLDDPPVVERDDLG